MTVSTLFGAPIGYSDASLSNWIAVLEESWVSLAGAGPGPLGADLRSLQSIFGQGASARALRASLRESSGLADALGLPEGALLRVGDQEVITPEGRILLDCLHQLRRSSSRVLTDSQVANALSMAIEVRSTWYREWALRQVSSNASPPVLGAAVFLLVNGSVGIDRALLLPNSESADRALGDVILPIISDFSEHLGGRRPTAGTGVRSHWVFTQLTRIFYRDIARSSTDAGTTVFVERDREERLIDDLRHRLDRQDAQSVARALESILQAYRTRRGRLISLGVAHEEPSHTVLVARALSRVPVVTF
jgi:hypothetical protein